MPNSQKEPISHICNPFYIYVQQAAYIQHIYLYSHVFIYNYRRTHRLLLLKISYMNSPGPNLASPLTEKSIETIKSYIIPIRVPNSRIVTNVSNICNHCSTYVEQRLLKCTADIYIFKFLFCWMLLTKASIFQTAQLFRFFSIRAEWEQTEQLETK